MACERGPGTAALATQIVAANRNIGGSVRVVNAKSTDLTFGSDELPVPQLVVSEIFGTDPLSETVLPVLKQASDQFATSGNMPAFLPCRCRVWGALARVPAAWESFTDDASCGDVEVGKLISSFESGTIICDLRSHFSDVELLTEPTVLVTHSLAPPILVSGSSIADLPMLPIPRPLHKMLRLPPPEVPGLGTPVSSSSSVCIVLWWDADCSLEPSDDPETRISTCPTVERGAHWSQYARVLRTADIGEGVLDAAAAAVAGGGEGAVRVTTTWAVDRTNFRVELVDDPQ